LGDIFSNPSLTRILWSGQAPHSGFIGQYRFSFSRLFPMRVRNS